jgi:hypothetical protein
VERIDQRDGRRVFVLKIDGQQVETVELKPEIEETTESEGESSVDGAHDSHPGQGNEKSDDGHVSDSEQGRENSADGDDSDPESYRQSPVKTSTTTSVHIVQPSHIYRQASGTIHPAIETTRFRQFEWSERVQGFCSKSSHSGYSTSKINP